MRVTKQIVIARAGVTDRGGVTKDSTNKGGGTLGSSKQQRIRTTIDNIEEAIKSRNKVNNGRMTAIMEKPDFTQKLVEGNLDIMKSRRAE